MTCKKVTTMYQGRYCGQGMEAVGEFSPRGILLDLSVSLVAPPVCTGCGESMFPASDVKWKCLTEGCKFKGRSVFKDGIHPVFVAK